MNYLDIIIGIFLLWGLINGFRKGLVIELSTLIALVLAIWGGIHLSHFVASWLSESWGWESDYLGIVSFGITFVGIVILVVFIGRLITRFLKLVALNIFNRFLGAVFGGIKYAFVLGMVIYLIEPLNKELKLIPEDKRSESKLYDPLLELSLQAFPALEKLDWRNWIEKSIDQGKGKLQEIEI